MLPICWIIAILVTGDVLCESADHKTLIDDLVNAGMKARGIPAVSLAVVKNGTIFLTKGYGVKDVKKNTEVDADTLFGLASLTKAMGNTALIKILRNNPKYKLNSSIHEILGRDQAKFNNTLLSSYATLQDLMVHAMGIPSNNFIRLDTDLTRDNLMARLQYLPPTTEFRHSFLYNDLMYSLLAHITEVIGGPGKLWEDIVTSELFRPLSMDKSTFLTRFNYSTMNVATPYSINKNKSLKELDINFIRHYSKTGGSGAIMSTANDMAKYMLFHVSGGKNQQGEQVIEKSDLDTIYTPLAALTSGDQLFPIKRPTTPVTMSTDGYGLGWRIGYYRGYETIQHTGSTYGYKAMITILPQFSSAVYVALSGSDDGYGFRASLISAILDLLLGENPWINTTTITTFPDPWITTSRRKRSVHSTLDQQTFSDKSGNEIDNDDDLSLTPESNYGSRHSQTKREGPGVLKVALTSFTGSYAHGAYGKANIIQNSTSGKLIFKYGIGQWELIHDGNDIFNGTWLGPPPAFSLRIRFLINGTVFGFECLSCDENYIPAFYRHQPSPSSHY